MFVEIDTDAQLRAHLDAGHSLDRVALQSVDLRPYRETVLARTAARAVFLGCMLDEALLAHAQRQGAVVLPALPDLPYHPFRPTLYSPSELMAGYQRGDRRTFDNTSLDGRIYHHFDHARKHHTSVVELLAQRLHDFSIDDALGDLLGEPHKPGSKRVMAIMGGHGLRRDEPAFRAVVRLGFLAARAGYFVATGGGPGAMEAGNLGAWLSQHDESACEQSVELLRDAPDYKHPRWFDAAYEVLDRFATGASSLAVPTWFYGHEPTNLFASHVAKYFSNSLREDGLLAIARHGVVYARGAAGTVQEVFMDATQNHYGTFGDVSPMVLMDTAYWTHKLPVRPLLEALAEGRTYRRMLTTLDDPAEIVAFLQSHPPVPYAP